MSKELDSIEGYYKQLHFKSNDLELFYNLPVVSPDNIQLKHCPHIDQLICSRAHELAPDKCITERDCEIYKFRDDLFKELGIRAKALLELDKKLRT
ncbi:MAG: hypothetical protein INQ03_01410 [Candidatus Heimdallarchaeota archaeon]|nr:hypothetical protein [Candidatus Heimdallarchaeota archaeon]